jgi:lipid-A-disaccharide synthase
VGHPLARVIPMQPDQLAARRQLGLNPAAQVLALLPGSRPDEIKYLAPRYFAAMKILKAQYGAMQCVLPCAPSLKAAIEAAAHKAGVWGDVLLLDGQSHAALAACDVALVASGTATLEAALFKRPMVIAYNMHGLSWILMKCKKLQPWVGLPNILCREFVVPELLQNAATPAALAQALADWFDVPEKVRRLEQRFVSLHQELLLDTPTVASWAIAEVFNHAASPSSLSPS